MHHEAVGIMCGVVIGRMCDNDEVRALVRERLERDLMCLRRSSVRCMANF